MIQAITGKKAADSWIRRTRICIDPRRPGRTGEGTIGKYLEPRIHEIARARNIDTHLRATGKRSEAKFIAVSRRQRQSGRDSGDVELKACGAKREPAENGKTQTRSFYECLCGAIEVAMEEG
jgi:hypothetical protein